MSSMSDGSLDDPVLIPARSFRSPISISYKLLSACLPAFLSSLSPTPLPPGLFSSLFSTGPIFRSQMPSNKPPAHPSASSTLGIRAD